MKRNSNKGAIILKDKNQQVLYKKFLNGLCTSEELALLFEYFKTSDKEELQGLIQEYFNQLDDESFADLVEEDALEDAFLKIKARTHPPKGSVFFKLSQWQPSMYIAAAAMVIIALSFVMHLYNADDSPIQKQVLNKEITPGGNKATLMLTGGKTIALSEEKDGLVIHTNEITYSDGTKIGNDSDLATNSMQYATLSTPNGGQYKIVLPDGSRLWLNAASSLKYPTKFTGEERRVVLTGEAYFEIEGMYSKTLNGKKKVPFIVETATQEVEVLGTHFNINSYSDESIVKTTLLEGSVHVSIPNSPNSILLKPNQESSIALGSNKIEVNAVDPAIAIAWKNGLFRFDKSNIYTVMRQISRWYDIDVVYEEGISYEPFYGEIQRNYNLYEVLNVLKLGGVEFRIENRNGRKQIVVI